MTPVRKKVAAVLDPSAIPTGAAASECGGETAMQRAEGHTLCQYGGEGRRRLASVYERIKNDAAGLGATKPRGPQADSHFQPARSRLVPLAPPR